MPNLLDDDPDNAADKNMIDRAATPARAYGVNEAMGPTGICWTGFEAASF